MRFFFGDLEANITFSLLFAALTDVQIHAHRAQKTRGGAAAGSLMRNDRTFEFRGRCSRVQSVRQLENVKIHLIKS